MNGKILHMYLNNLSALILADARVVDTLLFGIAIELIELNTFQYVKISSGYIICIWRYVLFSSSLCPCLSHGMGAIFLICHIYFSYSINFYKIYKFIIFINYLSKFIFRSLIKIYVSLINGIKKTYSNTYLIMLAPKVDIFLLKIIKQIRSRFY